MVIEQVNKLFEREPSMRMVRTLDDRARAFLSDRFRRIDNDLILAKTLPKLANAAGELPASRIIGSHLTEDSMRIRVLWTDPALEQEIDGLRYLMSGHTNSDKCVDKCSTVWYSKTVRREASGRPMKRTQCPMKILIEETVDGDGWAVTFGNARVPSGSHRPYGTGEHQAAAGRISEEQVPCRVADPDHAGAATVGMLT